VEVYVTIDDKRAFLVPEGGALPDGSLAVRDLDGAERRVAEAAVAQHEVTADQARAHLREQFDTALAGIVAHVAEALGESRDPQRLAQWAGLPTADRRAVEEALQQLAADIRTVAAPAASRSSAEVEAARARLRSRWQRGAGAVARLAGQLEQLQRVRRDEPGGATDEAREPEPVVVAAPLGDQRQIGVVKEEEPLQLRTRRLTLEPPVRGGSVQRLALGGGSVRRVGTLTPRAGGVPQ
jgi:hypothetical protein